MSRPKPTGGDTPQAYLDRQPFTVEPSEKLKQTNVDLARHNLEVTLKRVKEGCFEAAKKIALEGPESKAREMDAFVQKQYAGETRKLAEWAAIMKRYESVDKEEN